MPIGRRFSRACAKNGDEIAQKCKEMHQKSQKNHKNGRKLATK